jgi:uncharacterized membrane protein
MFQPQPRLHRPETFAQPAASEQATGCAETAQETKGEREMATRSLSTSTTVLLASAVAGLIALNTFGARALAADKTDDGKVKCYGANSCKGSGACAGAGHACAGHNACKGQGFVKADSEEACLKMAGGRLTAEASK